MIKFKIMTKIQNEANNENKEHDKIQRNNANYDNWFMFQRLLS